MLVSGVQQWFRYLYIYISIYIYISSVQFSRSVVSDSLRPHGLQHTRPPCPSPTPGIDSNSSPLSRWCHPTISSSVVPFSSHLQSFPASGSFQMSQFFVLGGQSIGVSASTSLLPRNIQDCFPLGYIYMNLFSYRLLQAIEYSRSPLYLKQWRICLQCRGPGFDPWVGKILWRREWQSTPVFLPGEFHGQRSLAGCSPWGCKELDTTEQLTLILLWSTFPRATQ